MFARTLLAVAITSVVHSTSASPSPLTDSIYETDWEVIIENVENRQTAADAIGVHQTGNEAKADITNKAELEVSGNRAAGIKVWQQGDESNSALNNAGDIIAEISSINAAYGYGMSLNQVASGTTGTLNNTGEIIVIVSADGYGFGSGMNLLQGERGSGTLNNTGEITVIASNDGHGMSLQQWAGSTSTLNNIGKITVTASGYGMYLQQGNNSEGTLNNSGTINNNGVGMFLSQGGEPQIGKVINSGTIKAENTGIRVASGNYSIINHGGTIAAKNGNAIEVRGNSKGILSFTNNGPTGSTIHGNIDNISDIKVVGDLFFRGDITNGDQFAIESQGTLILDSPTDIHANYLQGGRLVLELGEGQSGALLNLKQNVEIRDSATIALSVTTDDINLANTNWSNQYALVSFVPDSAGDALATTSSSDININDQSFTVISSSSLLGFESYNIDHQNGELSATVRTLDAGDVGRNSGASANASEALRAYQQDMLVTANKDSLPYQVFVNGSASDLARLGNEMTPDHAIANVSAMKATQTSVNNQVLNRLAVLRTGIATGDMPTEYGLWGQYLYNQSKLDSVDNMTGYKSRSHGFTLGFDKQVSSDWTLGLGFSYNRINSNARGASDKTETDGYLGTLYASYARNDWFADITANYGINKNTSNIAIAGTPDKDDYRSYQRGVRIIGGRNVGFGDLTVQPKLGASYTHLQVSHQNYEQVALEIDKQRFERFQLGAGAGISQPFTFQRGVLEPSASLMFWHNLTEPNNNVGYSFIGSDTRLIAFGPQLKRNNLEGSLGVRYLHGNNMTYKFEYSRLQAKNFRSDSLIAKVKYEF